MELSNRKALIERSKYLIDKYSFDALKIAEQEFLEVEKEGELESDSRF